MPENKIPFKKEIADNTLIIIDLFIDLAKSYDNNLSLEKIIETKKYFTNLYYNDKVELLTVNN